MNSVAKGGGALAIASVGLLAFLGLWEGDEQHTVYADSLAGGLPTVCRGLTRHITDTPIVVGETWTEEQCRLEERKAVEKVQTRLLTCFDELPSQSVFDAATSHAWNFGVGKTCGSDSMKAWNAGQTSVGCLLLFDDGTGKPNWSYVKTADGFKFVQGLQNRRRDEFSLCMGYKSSGQ
ncbi:hypothetical protein [uncultured Gilvimarinus sp.]|uniref:lysozyme n=1 Tax=uncultured Gilvimarinus sp. TaxID=1689143 RepID=UPI0030EEC1D9